MSPRSTIPKGQRIPQGITESLAPADDGPATMSIDALAMAPYYTLVADLLEGLAAVLAGGETYLPRHPEEEQTDWQYRQSNGVLTNIFADIIETLAAKPFDDELGVIDGSASTDFVGTPVKVDGKDTGKRTGGFVENVDGKGSHIHVFSHEVFREGIAAGMDWIFVDYPKAPKTLTASQEKAMNIRPYWYRVPAKNMLEVHSALIGGNEDFIYMRFKEWKQIKAVGSFISELREQVREIIRAKVSGIDGAPDSYANPVWVLWEKDPTVANATTEAEKWKSVDRGEYSIGIIPAVPFITGKRRGTTWQVNPPMRTAADLQIKLFQQETGLENAKNLCCYPMLSASGVDLTDDDGEQIKIIIGPHTILAAPPSADNSRPGEWKFLEPQATSLEFVAKRIEVAKQELRELGRQPLTANSTNLTVVTSAFASQKANSAVEAWALRLKDALENALLITAMWMKDSSQPEVRVKTNFPLGVDDTSTEVIQKMREDGDLSRKTYWDEMKRREILSPEFDADAEEDLLKAELPTDAEALAAAGGANPDDPGTSGAT